MTIRSRIRRRLRGGSAARLATTVLVLTLAGCDEDLTLPARESPIRIIVGRDVHGSGGDPTVWVKADPAEECGVVFSIARATDIARRTPDGGLDRALVLELQVGAEVRVWAVGNTVLRSCPGQARAEAIEIVSDTGPPLRTDRWSYELREDEEGNLRTEIGFHYRNTTGETVYLTGCRGPATPRLDKWTGGEWVRAWAPVWEACPSEPWGLWPRAPYSDSLHLFAGRPDGDSYPKFEVDDPEGTYRLVWTSPVHDYDPETGGGAPLPLWDRTSNAFELRFP